MRESSINWVFCFVCLMAVGASGAESFMHDHWGYSVVYAICSVIWLVGAGFAASAARTWRRVEEMS